MKYDELTPRQKQIMRLVALGFTTIQIAKSLCISPTTVNTHIYATCEKLSIFGIQGSAGLRCKITTIYWKNNIQELQELDLKEIVE